MSFRLDRVVVIGVGLIGGSFALALKAARAARHVVGLGRSARNLNRALRLGVIDEKAEDFEAARGADLVLLAMPVGQMGPVMRSLAPHLDPHTIVTDAGSTKRDVIDQARREFGAEIIKRFVPAHPIAGAEHSGVEAASAELFRGRTVILTPLAGNGRRSIGTVSAAWRACGARTVRMAPNRHDAILAAVSHLPHLLSFGLVHQIAGRGNARELFSHAAGGFRDFTRIASSHPEMWRDICLSNSDALLVELARYQDELARLASLLKHGEGRAIEKIFESARAARNRWIRSLR